MEINVGIFYLCIHKKLDERIGRNRVMNKKDFYDILGRIYHLPKKLWPCVLKEMIQMDMIEDLGSRKNNNIFVKKMLIDPIKDANKFYEKLKIFGLLWFIILWSSF